MDGWIYIRKYWEELVIKIEWHSSVNKYTFEIGGAIWKLPLDPAKFKDIWHLLTEHDSFSFLIKFNEVFNKKKRFGFYTFSAYLKIVVFWRPGNIAAALLQLKVIFLKSFLKRTKKRDYIKNVNSIILKNANFTQPRVFLTHFPSCFLVF